MFLLLVKEGEDITTFSDRLTLDIWQQNKAVLDSPVQLT